jgi:hypothetical protein
LEAWERVAALEGCHPLGDRFHSQLCGDITCLVTADTVSDDRQ